MKFSEDQCHNNNSILKGEKTGPWIIEPIKDIIM